MKAKNLKKKKASAQKGNTQNGKKRFSIENDPFFNDSKRRKRFGDDEDIESSDDDDEELYGSDDEGIRDKKEGNEEEQEEEETAAERRKRVAEAYLKRIRESARREEEERESEDEGGREEREGMRDSVVANILQQEQMEESGRVRKAIASRIQKPTEGFRLLVKHRQSVTAVTLSEDDLKGFSSSKDGTIASWDVDSGKREKYAWPTDEVLKSHGAKEPQGRAKKHSKHVLALAVSSDGRYLASGGLDRHIHLWDVRTRQHIKAFPGHKGPVSCLTFRQGSSELFSGSFDRSIKIWNVEDRAYVNTLFGHQSEVLSIDSLRKERVLTVGRDRTMHLWKVPEESQLIFRAPATNLECCCFINNDEFLSGSDDGSIEHWNVLRKKPVHIVKNAHASLQSVGTEPRNGALSNGHMENGTLNPESRSSSALSWVSALTVCRNSDLAASGAGNGSVRLWAIENESKGIRPLFELPVAGFINSLIFSKSGQFLVAGVGQEPRLGRWGRIADVRNGVLVQPLKLS
ncbi:PREDICTED: U3 snoRNP-associated protein-like YAOH [Nicotiana attenuata]|uniref:U3 snornp-associated protein-like yaoh n=1 Tax=Nicotiana attenuata TaxID=49451 RepID=A0A1J6J5H8_NICAT|nr:PREDICTED: U3 snoRNP-associated protein-like YAOH [Nicotiana attenuata]OIT06163.1 u3 snornp-associated protein-like yaoh [Nicotiana attenuata]